MQLCLLHSNYKASRIRNDIKERRYTIGIFETSIKVVNMAYINEWGICAWHKKKEHLTKLIITKDGHRLKYCAELHAAAEANALVKAIENIVKDLKEGDNMNKIEWIKDTTKRAKIRGHGIITEKSYEMAMAETLIIIEQEAKQSTAKEIFEELEKLKPANWHKEDTMGTYEGDKVISNHDYKILKAKFINTPKRSEA